MKLLHKRILIIIAIGITAAVVAASYARERRFAGSETTRLIFLDVGQGDAALIRDSGGLDVLIDAGPDGSVLEGLSREMPWWDRRIDVILVTHLDADHYAGLFGVLGRYDIGAFWWNGAIPTTDTARRLIAEVERRGIPMRAVHAGARIEFPRGRSLEIIHPFDDVAGRVPPKAGKNGTGGPNDWSIVVRFSCGSDAALLTGDISQAVEKTLVVSGASIEASVLKVAHHGSAHSSAEAFLDAVRPNEAVISSGLGNRYGHPAARVLRALIERGITVRRTDREGDTAYVCSDEGLHRR